MNSFPTVRLRIGRFINTPIQNANTEILAHRARIEINSSGVANVFGIVGVPSKLRPIWIVSRTSAETRRQLVQATLIIKLG
jgi:hypothetical protein